MSGSQIQCKAEIKAWIDQQNDIKVIVDVGAGSATYPKLLGNKYTYIGIEIWAPYVKQFKLHNYYKEIIVGDIRHVNLPVGDCIIFGDILEHLPKKDALEVFFKANNLYKHIILSIPFTENGEVTYSKIRAGNICEQHLSGWTLKELNSLTFWKYTVDSKHIGVFCK
jgi:hypothetical protein